MLAFLNGFFSQCLKYLSLQVRESEDMSQHSLSSVRSELLEGPEQKIFAPTVNALRLLLGCGVLFIGTEKLKIWGATSMRGILGMLWFWNKDK